MLDSLPEATIRYQIAVSRYLVFSPFVVLVYDHLLTLDDEVARYWPRRRRDGSGDQDNRLTFGSVLFFLNRYTALLGTIPVLAEFLLSTDDPAKHSMCVCAAFTTYHGAFALFSQIPVALILITRTYALYEQNKAVLAAMTFVCVGSIINALAFILTGQPRDTLSAPLAALGCPGATPNDFAKRGAIAWSGLLVFDLMIFVLTVAKTLKPGLSGSRRGESLFLVLLRDGALYFAVLSLLNAINIYSYAAGGPIMSGAGTTFTNVFSSVGASRLMLNLRSPRLLNAVRRSGTRTGRASTSTGLSRDPGEEEEEDDGQALTRISTILETRAEHDDYEWDASLPVWARRPDSRSDDIGMKRL
ncbi:hypothetical protein HMN09_00937000 [Mycena chlorophos]|uniref:DUF6533 domain-containing protein n=1 Tax=Mycena chlorophos TaxID=658473 RepID=A0A8H6SKK8_MYCCL|nr:hypothetical protein HMN09_00937000 [Mycena chlorophos]